MKKPVKKAAKKKPSAIGSAIMMLADAMSSRHSEMRDRLDFMQRTIDSNHINEYEQLLALKSGQNMLSERIQVVIQDVEALQEGVINSFQANRERVESLQSAVTMLSERLQSLYDMVEKSTFMALDHTVRLMKEKEKLQKQVALLTAEQYTVTQAPMEREDNLYATNNDGFTVFENNPLHSVGPEDATTYYFGDSGPLQQKKFEESELKAAANFMSAPLNPPTVYAPSHAPAECDHEILSPRTTIKFDEGRRYCSACMKYISGAGT